MADYEVGSVTESHLAGRVHFKQKRPRPVQKNRSWRLDYHNIDWDNPRILATKKLTTSRLHLESLTIQTTPNMVKRNDRYLNLIYARSLKRLHRPI